MTVLEGRFRIDWVPCESSWSRRRRIWWKKPFKNVSNRISGQPFLTNSSLVENANRKIGNERNSKRAISSRKMWIKFYVQEASRSVEESELYLISIRNEIVCSGTHLISLMGIARNKRPARDGDYDVDGTLMTVTRLVSIEYFVIHIIPKRIVNICVICITSRIIIQRCYGFVIPNSKRWE